MSGNPRRTLLNFVATLAACAAMPSGAALDPGASANDAAALRARHAQLRDSLAHNDFGRPLHLESTEGNGRLKGDVYAELAHPYARVQRGLADAAGWCELLTLPFNVKRCEAHGSDGISLFIGRTPETPVAQATRIDFHYAVLKRSDDLLQVRLDAPSGPLGTKGYRIVLDATPLAEGRTFMHMSYGYAFGALSRLAMQTYLATSGSHKVGFSRGEDGEPLVKGMRGVLERNTMRYFLAIEAYLDTLAAPPAERASRRLLAWFDATERYPRQLHEMERDDYLALKRRDLAAAGTRVAEGS
jgi:hypothetical protein